MIRFPVIIKTIYFRFSAAFAFFLIFFPGFGSPPARSAELPPAGSPEFVLKLSAVAPEGTSWADTAHKFQKYVEQKSAGRIKVIWYLGAVMGDEPDEIRKMTIEKKAVSSSTRG